MNKLSILKNRFFPSFYKYDAPKLIDFFGYYLEWMESENNSYWIIDNIQDFTDIDGTIDLYIDHLKSELMNEFPLEYAGDLRYIMKHLVLLYQSKGTEASFKFFFRALYNSFCEITYPREKLLKLSAGNWIQGYYLYSSELNPIDMNKYAGKTIIEEETGYTSLINNIVPHYFKDEAELKYSFVIVDNTNNFTIGNTLRIVGTSDTFIISNAEYTTGYWEGSDGFLDSDKVIQDSYYYQNFSYELTSLISVNEYRDILKKLFHPAGLQLFGKIKLNEEIEEHQKTPTSVLRWIIINIFLNTIAYERNAETFHKIICFPIICNEVYTSDMQYFTKNYGSVSRIEDTTPRHLESLLNESNKIVFSNGYRIEPNFALNKLPNNISKYSVIGLSAISGVYKTECINGKITIDPDCNITTGLVWIFIDGKKIADKNINRVNNIYTITGVSSGNAIVYFHNQNIISRTIKTNINTNNIDISYSSKNRLIVFINGLFVSDNISYNNSKLILPSSIGYLEIYEVIPHENYSINTYTIINNETNNLYMKNKLKNIY